MKLAEEMARNATSGSGVSINIPVIGSASTTSIQKSANSRSVILVDRHRVFMK